MQKFEFCIRTHSGQLIERLCIGGRDRADAERKLMQMYRYCEIVSCNTTSNRKPASRPAAAQADELASAATR